MFAPGAQILIESVIQENWNRLNDPWVREWSLSVSPEAFLHEFATVHLSLGRGAGHTNYIQENALRNDLILVPRHDRAREFARGYIYTVKSIINGVMRGKRVDRVWVDEPAMCFRTHSDKVEFYEHAAHMGAKQIIMLGV